MTTAIYLRVSSPKGQKTDSQRAELEAWLKRHHYQSVQWFEDRESATTQALRLPNNAGCKPDASGARPRPHRRARALRQQGLTVREIAQALGVKERTVYYYLQARA